MGEHQLAGRLSEYPLIVVPEWEYLEATFKQELVSYVKAGGSLLLIGPKTAALFSSELGVTLEGEPSSKPQQLTHNGALAPIKGQTQAVKLSANARVFGKLQGTNAASATAHPAASITELGRGKIAGIYFSVGQSYPAARSEVVRQFTSDLARELFPKPMVEVRGSPGVDVSLARNHGKLLVNLVNTSGPHQREPILDQIPPVGPLTVTIRLPSKPARVTLEPGGQNLAFDYRAGEVLVAVSRLEIHNVLVIE